MEERKAQLQERRTGTVSKNGGSVLVRSRIGTWLLHSCLSFSLGRGYGAFATYPVPVQVKYRSSVQYRPPRASSLRLEWLGSQVLARQVCCAVLLSLRSRPEAVTAIRTPLCMEITSPRVATTSQGYSLVWLVRQNGACHLTAASRICASQFFLLCVQVSEPWSQLCHTCSKWTSMRAREPSGVLA